MMTASSTTPTRRKRFVAESGTSFHDTNDIALLSNIVFIMVFFRIVDTFTIDWVVTFSFDHDCDLFCPFCQTQRVQQELYDYCVPLKFSFLVYYLAS